MMRRAASYAVRVLKGESPATMAIEQPTEFELVINLRTAAALGVLIPQSVRFRASRLID
jgi:putative tryptophan/tyrosine transport system substrate-binding protein